MKDTCGIYMIRNKINDKVYIGQSIHIQNRLDGHKRELRKGRHDSRHLQFAWDKYGEENFEFLSICECRKEKLNEMEQYYILCFESYLGDFGYNTSLGGQSSLMREETRIKIGNSVRGEKNGFYGKHHTEEQKGKWSEQRSGKNAPAYGRTGEKHPFYGKHHTEEAKEKMRQALDRKSVV